MLQHITQRWWMVGVSVDELTGIPARLASGDEGVRPCTGIFPATWGYVRPSKGRDLGRGATPMGTLVLRGETRYPDVHNRYV